MNKSKKRIAVIAAAATVVVGGGAAAWAAWSSSGSASVSATAGQAVGLTVTGTSVVGSVRPGHPADVTFTLTNPNDYAVTLTGLQLSNFQPTGSTNAACDVSATFEDSGAAIPTVNLAGSGSQSVTWTGALQLTATPDNDCQNQPFTFDVTATADSV